MKYLFLIITIFLFVGCSNKQIEEKIVIKDNYVFINKCDLNIPEELLKTDKINIIEGKNEEEIKNFILDLYKKNKDNQRKIKTINDLFFKYKKCL